MPDRLEPYRAKRDPERTPEPVPKRGRRRNSRGDSFVVQQHHARALHWDFRLERDGVLVSWAVPKGVPRDPKTNHLAVHTEDHPLEYADFSGEIPEGEYGGGTVNLYDRGTYTTEKWRDDEVIVTLSGERVSGRYVLFRTGERSGRDEWMMHRMDPPEPGWEPPPRQLAPMRATPGRLPRSTGWAYEMRWDGVRAVGFVVGGRLRLAGGDGADLTGRFPELRPLGEALAPVECVLDGEVVLFRDGRLDPGGLADRAALTDSARARRLGQRRPVTYLIYDLLYADGESFTGLPYARRRERLDALGIASAQWQVPPYFPDDGKAALATSRDQGLPGVVAKRLDAPYRPGEESRDWRSIDG